MIIILCGDIQQKIKTSQLSNFFSTQVKGSLFHLYKHNGLLRKLHKVEKLRIWKAWQWNFQSFETILFPRCTFQHCYLRVASLHTRHVGKIPLFWTQSSSPSLASGPKLGKELDPSSPVFLSNNFFSAQCSFLYCFSK